MKNANLRACEEVLKTYIQAANGESLRSKLGGEAWEALTGPAKTYGLVYTVSDCLLVLATVPLILSVYLAAEANPSSITACVVALVLIAQWTMLFYSHQANSKELILQKIPSERNLAVRLFFRFHQLAANGKIELLDDEDPFGTETPVVVSPAILRGDHGWLPLLGAERGSIRLKGIWLRRPPRSLKVDLDSLVSNHEVLGELSLLEAAAGSKLLAAMSAIELTALRATLLKVNCLDEILQNALDDISAYQLAFEIYRLKESAIRVAAEQSKLSGSVEGRMSRIRELIDGKNKAVSARLSKAVERLARCSD